MEVKELGIQTEPCCLGGGMLLQMLRRLSPRGSGVSLIYQAFPSCSCGLGSPPLCDVWQGSHLQNPMHLSSLVASLMTLTLHTAEPQQSFYFKIKNDDVSMQDSETVPILSSKASHLNEHSIL